MASSELVPDSDPNLVEKVTEYVRDYMSSYDASHDFNHILRVLGLARLLANNTEKNTSSQVIRYNPLIVTLSALLHDVGDKKYLKPGERAETMVYELLVEFGASEPLAETVQTVVSNVSFSAETKSTENMENVRRLVREIPELGVVQDADRLDAIGGVGIGRTFTYGATVAAKKGGKGGDMQDTIQHFTDKLERLESLMKTEEGKKLAAERTRRLKMFRGWWEEEIQVGQV